MRRGSIALSLVFYSLIWLVLALAVTGYLLTNLYYRALDNTLRDSLEFNVETLAGIALTLDGGQIPETSLADPRFSRPASGWYWQIKDADGAVLSFSPSLVGSLLPELTQNFDENNARTGVLADGFGSELRIVERRISIEDQQLWISVTGNLDEMQRLVDAFQGQTLIVLGAVGAMLAAMSGIVGRFALRPIGRLRRSVEAVREGEQAEVEGKYPTEIAPLAEEINALLRSNTQIIERARSQVGNLAHGLKTPLAVLRNEAAGNRTALAKIVGSEAEKMGDLVANYLERARLSARTAVVGQKTDAGAAASRLVRVMQKLHPDIDIRLEGDQTSNWFRGEQNDFEEIIGNLIDNACKWANSRVAVTLTGSTSPLTLTITIEDDGKGLSEDEILKVQERGVRLDEKVPGSGLGLDIVKELVEVYGGSLAMSRSALGGLSVKLNLPAVKRPIN